MMLLGLGVIGCSCSTADLAFIEAELAGNYWGKSMVPFTKMDRLETNITQSVRAA
jgi:hypothetical protein